MQWWIVILPLLALATISYYFSRKICKKGRISSFFNSVATTFIFWTILSPTLEDNQAKAIISSCFPIVLILAGSYMSGLYVPREGIDV